MSKYLDRVHARLMKRAMRADDDAWKTINGTHVLVNEGGEIKGGPKALKDVSQKATKGGTQTYKPKKSQTYRKVANFVKKNGIPSWFTNKGLESDKDVYKAIADHGKLTDAQQKIFDKIKYNEEEGRIYYNGASRNVKGLTDDEIKGAKMFMAKSADEHSKKSGGEGSADTTVAKKPETVQDKLNNSFGSLVDRVTNINNKAREERNPGHKFKKWGNDLYTASSLADRITMEADAGRRLEMAEDGVAKMNQMLQKKGLGDFQKRTITELRDTLEKHAEDLKAIDRERQIIGGNNDPTLRRMKKWEERKARGETYDPTLGWIKPILK